VATSASGGPKELSRMARTPQAVGLRLADRRRGRCPGADSPRSRERRPPTGRNVTPAEPGHC
jgi:hypothetical protein